jgi:hypothetical protein
MGFFIQRKAHRTSVTFQYVLRILSPDISALGLFRPDALQITFLSLILPSSPGDPLRFDDIAVL